VQFNVGSQYSMWIFKKYIKYFYRLNLIIESSTGLLTVNLEA
jgi:hypothetical protein